MKRTILATLLLLACLGCTQRRDAARELSSEADLTGLTLAVSSGSYYHAKFSQRQDVTLFVTNTEADAVQAARQGRADVYVGDEVALTREEMDRLGLRIAFLGDETFDVAFALRKGDAALKEQLDGFLATAPVDAIVAHWIEGGPAVEEPVWEMRPGAEPLRCVLGINLAPVAYIGEGGEWLGMDPDLIRRFAHSLGRPLEISLQDISSAIIAIQAGQADVFAGCLFPTEERRTAVDFSEPYYRCRPAYFVPDAAGKTHLTLRDRLRMNLSTENRWRLIVDGLLETLKITLLSVLLGTVLGAGVCACRRSRRAWVRSLAGLYGDFINGIPTLVLLLIMFFIVFAGTGVNASMVAVVTFALTLASSAGSIFDTAISSVPRGQTEAGLALGFTPLRTFAGIVFPQAVKSGLPLYAGECVSLLKNTSIVGYIAIQDLTRASDLIRSRTFDALIPLLVVTVLYFVLAWLIRLLLTLFLKKK